MDLETQLLGFELRHKFGLVLTALAHVINSIIIIIKLQIIDLHY